jgi:hypothetical protein
MVEHAIADRAWRGSLSEHHVVTEDDPGIHDGEPRREATMQPRDSGTAPLGSVSLELDEAVVERDRLVGAFRYHDRVCAGPEGTSERSRYRVTPKSMVCVKGESEWSVGVPQPGQSSATESLGTG